MPVIDTNRAQFQFQIARFVEKAQGKLELFARRYCQEISDRVIAATPIGVTVNGHNPGELRGSWKMNPSPGSIELGQRWTMTNTAPYAMRIEFGFSRHPDSLGRKYHQKGRGFVRGVFRSAGLLANGVAQSISGT